VDVALLAIKNEISAKILSFSGKAIKDLEGLLSECSVHNQKQQEHFDTLEKNAVVVFDTLISQLENKKKSVFNEISTKRDQQKQLLKDFQDQISSEYESVKNSHQYVQTCVQSTDNRKNKSFKYWNDVMENAKITLDR
jgi:hypothetical protein